MNMVWGGGSRSVVMRNMAREGYDRIKWRIRNELGRQQPSLFIAAAFTLLGIAASAGFVVLAFPTKPGSGIPVGAKGNAETIAIATGIGFVLCLGAYWARRRHIAQISENICHEMDVHAGLAPSESAPRRVSRIPLTRIEIIFQRGRRATP
jgi:hypothetical protein